MGIVVKAMCQCSKEEAYFSLGLGMKDFQNPIPNQLGYCSICDNFYSVKENELCPKKHNVDVVYTADMSEAGIDEIECPRCKKVMSMEFAGLWD